MKIHLYQVDAFTDVLFGGNPAAVCPLEKWISLELMKKIAEENNPSETAFFVPCENQYEIRWFTPKTEVDLCGHATLAAVYVIFNFLNKNRIKSYSKARTVNWLLPKTILTTHSISLVCLLPRIQ